MRPSFFNFTPFSAFSRRKQRDLYVALRWRIKRYSHVFGGQFYSNWVLDEPNRPVWFNQDYRCHFLGSDRYTIWTLDIETASRALWSTVGGLAFNEIYAQMSDDEREREFQLHTRPIRRGARIHYEVLEPTIHYPQFGGMTYREYRPGMEQRIIETAPPDVYESFVLDRGYQYGIGVHAVVDVPHIDRTAIEHTIRRFLEIGERDWRADDPIPHAHLPSVTFERMLANANEREMEYARTGKVV